MSEKTLLSYTFIFKVLARSFNGLSRRIYLKVAEGEKYLDLFYLVRNIIFQHVSNLNISRYLDIYKSL